MSDEYQMGDPQPDDAKDTTRASALMPDTLSSFDGTRSEPPGSELADTTQLFDLGNLPYVFGKYRLLEAIGAGGVGVVFRASVEPDGKTSNQQSDVAVKLIRPNIITSQQAVRRFEKEARLLAEVNSPFIPKFHEFGFEQGLHFLVNELVDGVGLNEAISTLKTRPVKESLVVIADVLKALSAMHSAGLIHRDVKPGNILVAYQSKDRAADAVNDSTFKIAKLTDFGLARHVEQSESLDMTRQQTVLGTPLYMAPEQHADSRNADARADIYSTGVALFEMISGRVPFDGQTATELAEMHRLERPIVLSKIRADVSDAVSNVVAKSLEKNPDLRYQHADEMLADIDRLLNNQPTSIRLYPAIPTANAETSKRYEFQWTLNATPAQLWPLIADTDRFNKALGLPAPQYTYDHSGDSRKIFANAKFNGMKLRWLEHPFQWICEREMSVLREFKSGPFKWLTSTVELHPMTNQRTRLTHRFQIQPRGLLGKLIVPFQFNGLMKRSIHRVYRRLEKIATDQSCPYACDVSFDRPPSLTNLQRRNLDARTKKLNNLVTNETLVASFSRFLETVADPFVSKIRPVSLAQKLACSPDDALRVCFHGVAAGLVNLAWDIICPVCRVATKSASSLENMATHERCEVCDIDFDVDFSQSVEAVFEVHPEIRSVETKTYCIGGPYHAPHVLAQNRLLRQQNVSIEVDLAEGTYAIRGPQLGKQPDLNVREGATKSRANIQLGRSPVTPVDELRPGKACVDIQNHSDSEVLVRLEKNLDRHGAITASVAAEHPVFRKLFPAEVNCAEQLVELKNVCLLGIKLCSADSLLDAMGDMQVRAMWNQTQRLFPADRSNGSVIECTHDRLVLAFETIDDLCEWFLRFFAQHEIAQTDEKLTLPVGECAFAINRGQVMVNQQAGQPTTFGKTVRRNKSLLENRSAGKLVLPQEMHSTITASNDTSISQLLCLFDELQPEDEFSVFQLKDL